MRRRVLLKPTFAHTQPNSSSLLALKQPPHGRSCRHLRDVARPLFFLTRATSRPDPITKLVCPVTGRRWVPGSPIRPLGLVRCKLYTSSRRKAFKRGSSRNIQPLSAPLSQTCKVCNAWRVLRGRDTPLGGSGSTVIWSGGGLMLLPKPGCSGVDWRVHVTTHSATRVFGSLRICMSMRPDKGSP